MIVAINKSLKKFVDVKGIINYLVRISRTKNIVATLLVYRNANRNSNIGALTSSRRYSGLTTQEDSTAEIHAQNTDPAAISSVE